MMSPWRGLPREGEEGRSWPQPTVQPVRTQGHADTYAVKLVPQPQVPVAFGFSNAKPEPISDSW